MIAQVIPILRLPRGRDFFTYAIPDEIAPQIGAGMFVHIPFHNRLAIGCILSLQKNTGDIQKLLPIKKIRSDAPILSAAQLNELKNLAALSGASIPTALKTFLPDFPASPLQIKIGATRRLRLKQSKNTGQTKRYLDLWLKEKKPVCVQYDQRRTKERCLIELARMAYTNRRSIHIFTARIEEAEFLYRLFDQAGFSVFLLHSRLSKLAQWRAWLPAAVQSPCVLITTKRYLLTPLTDPLVIINDEEVDEFKQRDLDPRYDARELLLSSKQKGLIIFSRVPRLETIESAKQKTVKLFRLRTVKTLAKIHFLHLATQDSPAPLLSLNLIEYIKEARDKQQTVILFHNRKGGFRLVRCAECFYIYQCPVCRLPAVSRGVKIAKQIVCPNCGRGTALACPHCRSRRLKMSSPGTEEIEQAIKRLFPNDNVFTLTHETSQLYNLDKADIIIATRAAERSVLLAPLKRLGLVAVTLAEFGLSGSDYAAEEKVFQFLASAALLGQEFHCPVIAQAINPDRPLFKALGSGQWQEWVSGELDERKKFFYPPFTDVVIVWYDGYKSQEQKGVQEIILNIKKCSSVINVLGSGSIQRRGRTAPAILMKVKKQSIAWQALIPPMWKIDRNPDSIPTL